MLVELARAMINAHELPEFLWELAVAHAAYLRNRAFTSPLGDHTPYEIWHNNKPNVAHLANSVHLSGFYTKDRLNNEKYNENRCDEPMLATMMVLIPFFITMNLHAKYYPHEISIFSHRLLLLLPLMTSNLIQCLKGRI